ncbi:MAG: hypothetical protein H7A54_14885 [Akkermansiaceae bacterium]|nr:hypothetical protein [Akkermansiaceae bacterium]
MRRFPMDTFGCARLEQAGASLNILVLSIAAAMTPYSRPGAVPPAAGCGLDAS